MGPWSTLSLERAATMITAMKIHFHGAAGDVTGAAFQVTTNRASVLVDCDRYQGRRQTLAQNLKPRWFHESSGAASRPFARAPALLSHARSRRLPGPA
jgi:hypothetical protein